MAAVQYRILSKTEAPLKTHSDFMFPKTIYTLIQQNGRRLRAILPRRHDWAVGNDVLIEEATVIDNLVE